MFRVCKLIMIQISLLVSTMLALYLVVSDQYQNLQPWRACTLLLSLFRLDMPWWLPLSVHVDHSRPLPGWGVQGPTVPRQGLLLPTQGWSIKDMLSTFMYSVRFHWFQSNLKLWTNYFFSPTVAVCTLLVFWGAGIRVGLSAEWPGLPSHATALSEHGATTEPHVPHHQRLLPGELISVSGCDGEH